MASGVVALEESISGERNNTSAFKAIEAPPAIIASARADMAGFPVTVVVYSRREVGLIGRDREWILIHFELTGFKDRQAALLAPPAERPTETSREIVNIITSA
jgi:hypothetical protein